MKQPIRIVFVAWPLLWLFGAISMTVSMTASGDWVNPPQEELVAQSDLVLLGEFLGRERITFAGDDGQLMVGVIKVETVFKGESRKSIVLLRLPPPRPGGLVSSADVVIEDGQRGLWYLRAGDDGLYTIDQPYRFIDIDYAEPHMRTLEGMR